MVLHASNRTMFAPNSNRHQVFNLSQYPYSNSGMPQTHYSSGMNVPSNGMNDPVGLNSEMQSTGAGLPWHTSVYPGSSCSRAYDDWSPPAAPSPHGSGSPGYGPPSHVLSGPPGSTQMPPHAHATASSFTYNYGLNTAALQHYRLGSASPGLDYHTNHGQFIFPPDVNLNSGSQPSPDSGVAHSSDGIPSESESPGVNSATTLGQHSIGNSSTGSHRPQPARSPFEWMKKPSYQTQPNPVGKTRTKDKYRVVYTDHQRLELEKEFHYSRYITIRRKGELAAMLGLSERQVKIWFQNRRAKERKQIKKREEIGRKIAKDVPPHLQITQESMGIMHQQRHTGSPLHISMKSIMESDSETCPCS